MRLRGGKTNYKGQLDFGDQESWRLKIKQSKMPVYMGKREVDRFVLLVMLIIEPKNHHNCLYKLCLVFRNFLSALS